MKNNNLLIFLLFQFGFIYPKEEHNANFNITTNRNVITIIKNFTNGNTSLFYIAEDDSKKNEEYWPNKLLQINTQKKEIGNQSSFNTLLIKQIKNKYFLLIILLLILLIFSNIFFLIYYYKNIFYSKLLVNLNKKIEILINEKKEIEIVNNRKQNFFTIIAHDLINPYNALLGYTNLLINDKENELTELQKNNIFTIIHESANSNYLLIKKLLIWAKKEQDKFTIDIQKLTIETLILEAIQPYLILSKKRNIDLKIIAKDQQKYYYTDSTIFCIVVGNIFNNALKNSNVNGSISISYQIDDMQSLNILVEDNGNGMSAELVNQFNFINTLSINNIEIKTSGLGLKFCYELIKLINGTITFNSQLNKGTLVKITIPLHKNSKIHKKNLKVNTRIEQPFEVSV